jgi:hypothetical protein
MVCRCAWPHVYQTDFPSFGAVLLLPRLFVKNAEAFSLRIQ